MDISVLLGKVLTSIDVDNSQDEILFKTKDGDTYKMYHEQNCCESVNIDDISGDLDDLLNSPITLAEEVTNQDDVGPKDDYAYSYTWTFYKLATVKGYVNIKWYGESNGYYSESVDFEKINN